MNKKIKILMVTCLVLLVCAIFASCSGNTYDEYDKAGYNITVKYDANGSYFGNAGQLYVTDTYSQESLKVNEDGKLELPLVNPEDDVRGKENAPEVARSAMPGYSFAGWYSKREALKDASGNIVKDDKGNTVYTYGGKWNFDGNYLLDVKDYSASEPAITFYAAWVRNPSVEIYDGENLVATYEIKNPMLGKNSIISAPYLDLKKGEYNFGTLKDALVVGTNTKYSWNERFVTYENGAVTSFFDGLYLDSACQSPISAEQRHTYTYDEATATIGNLTMKLYINYEQKDGEWYRVYSAKQFVNNAKADGNYEIMADIEFDELTAWPNIFKNNDFSGTISGGGFKISGIVLESSSSKTFGMFKSLTKDAKIENVVFDGVSALIERADRTPGARYALVAASIEEGFAFENVEFTDAVLKISASSPIQYSPEYEIGLVCADGYTDNLGISLDGFSYEVVTSELDTSILTITQNGNSLELLFEAKPQE